MKVYVAWRTCSAHKVEKHEGRRGEAILLSSRPSTPYQFLTSLAVAMPSANPTDSGTKMAMAWKERAVGGGRCQAGGFAIQTHSRGVPGEAEYHQRRVIATYQHTYQLEDAAGIHGCG